MGPSDDFSDELAANADYVSQFRLGGLEPIAARGLAVLTCMDSRIEPLAMLGLAPGDAKILRNAGARVTDDVLRTFVLARYLLGVDRIMVVAHTGCRMAGGTEQDVHDAVRAAGGPDTAGMSFLVATDQEAAVRADVERVRSSPYLGHVTVGGFMYDVDSGHVSKRVLNDLDNRPMTDDRLDRRQLSRATLERQLLLRPAELSPIEAVEHLVGLQAQAPLAPYIALWSRLQAFDPNALAATLDRREVVRTHAMRATIHLLSADDAVELRALTQPVQVRGFNGQANASALAGLDLDTVVAAGEQLLSRTPLTRAQMGLELAERFPGREPTSLASAVSYLLPLVQPPPRGLWGRGGPAAWQTLAGWLGRPLASTPSVDHAVLRYLGAFGPASVADARTWSGLPRLREVFERLRSRLRTFRSPDGAELFDLPDAPRPDADVEAPVRFLPEYDNLLLSHADRSRVIPDGRPVPLPPGDGARVGTVLVDGDFRATWRLAVRDGSAAVHVTASPPLPPRQEDAVVEEGSKLIQLVAPDAEHRDVTFSR